MEVQVMTNVLAKNDAIAESLQQRFQEHNIFVFNLLGSPGAGKTSLLEATLQDLVKDYKLAVIEGDLYTSKDADRIHTLGIPVLQINTIGGCHLDAKMIEDGNPRALLDIVRDYKVDILIAGGRNMYTALKARVPFLDINQEREFGYAGYEGMLELAKQLTLTVESPIWQAVRKPAPWTLTANTSDAIIKEAAHA